MRRALAMVLAASALVAALPAGRARAQHEAALEAVNDARRAAGLWPLTANARLDHAAQGHAAYLARNNLSEHVQQSRRAGFTGRMPGDRAQAAGYPAAGVSENLAKGMATAAEAVDGLMAAIYHRFGFLALDIDELGVGLPPGEPKASPWVFNMGDSGLVALCEHPPEAARFQPPGRYAQLCGPDGPKLRIAAVEAAQNRLAAAAPQAVLWPPPGYHRASPAFFEEEPDPLPDRAVSGNPVSIQFNRVTVKRAVLRGFTLRAVVNGAEQDPGALRRLDQRSDPNGHFTAHDFAWFPLQRLEWGTEYRVTADFDVDGAPKRFAWSFRTREPGLPLLRLGTESRFWIAADTDYAFYVPPTARFSRVDQFAWSYPQGVTVDGAGIDPNTLRVRVSGPPCADAGMKLPGGRQVTFRLLPPGQDAAQAEAACRPPAPDFTVRGRGDALALSPGRSYLLQLTPASGRTGVSPLQWESPDTMAVTAKLEGTLLRVEVSGKPCDQAQFTYAGGRTFSLAVAGAKCLASGK